MEVVYLKHPVSAETKAEYRSKGIRILDERFKPVEAKKPKTTPKRKPKS
jgi:hypothetical protein